MTSNTSNNGGNGHGGGHGGENGGGHGGGHGNGPELFIDSDPYDWDKPKITGAQIRKLAHLPESVLIYQKIPGKTDRPIMDDTTVDLTPKGPEHFSSQAPGSQAGG